ncbi:uncharacterized protein GGS25DRAFT_473764 [Hypoxylon fragiforme]|uniref:uncharacterized protein n=1 Tax=Hypoxylon fragiforme TaxID=63214 RepID=UPI0020C5D975|nr:uncharacterized protein GGS25DRAFT_473764 [Hypoxylon fragiforme]KAI2612098.1 hypothetical protein GGS25DRAFT_473764 [Hypoxylon fragiforme]
MYSILMYATIPCPRVLSCPCVLVDGVTFTVYILHNLSRRLVSLVSFFFFHIRHITYKKRDIHTCVFRRRHLFASSFSAFDLNSPVQAHPDPLLLWPVHFASPHTDLPGRGLVWYESCPFATTPRKKNKTRV